MDYKKLSIFLGSLLSAFIIAFVIFPWCCGYELHIINGVNWNLEDTYHVAGVVAPFLSLITIAVAVWIPKKIAERQDDIALFEKRFNCYITFNRIRFFATTMKSVWGSENPYIGKGEKWLELVENLTEGLITSEKVELNSRALGFNFLIEDKILAQYRDSAEFLFDFSSKEKEELWEITLCYSSLCHSFDVLTNTSKDYVVIRDKKYDCSEAVQSFIEVEPLLNNITNKMKTKLELRISK